LTRILYYLILVPLSYLPFWFLYAVSSFFCIILYRVVGYRTKVVLSNIQNSFPEKTAKEHKAIMNAFYRHFCDIFIETLKAFSLTKKQAAVRFKVINNDALNDLYAKKRHIVLVLGHYNNWEWLALCGQIGTQHKSIGFYTPLKDKFFNEKLRKSRERFGMTTVPTSDPKMMFAEMKERPSMMYFGSDQSPRKSQKCYWTTFLNQETGVQFGAEKIATKTNAAVVFGKITKIKRGHYTLEYQLLCENPNEVEPGTITKKHVQALEEIIKEKPQFWLWSHRRWKHKRPEGEPLN
jgi:KDO2-lipid IV(A) lauroyltransferase